MKEGCSSYFYFFSSKTFMCIFKNIHFKKFHSERGGNPCSACYGRSVMGTQPWSITGLPFRWTKITQRKPGWLKAFYYGERQDMKLFLCSNWEIGRNYIKNKWASILSSIKWQCPRNDFRCVFKWRIQLNT